MQFALLTVQTVKKLKIQDGGGRHLEKDGGGRHLENSKNRHISAFATHFHQHLGRVEEMVFVARRSYASAVLGVVGLSVCPSVPLSGCHTRAF